MDLIDSNAHRQSAGAGSITTSPKITVTTWRTRFETAGSTQTLPIDEFIEGWLAAPLEVPVAELTWDAGNSRWHKPDALPLFAAAHFDGGVRGKATLLQITAAVFEHDDGNLSPADIEALWGGFAGIAYTTFNSTPDRRRWRILLILERPLLPAEWQATFEHIVDLAGDAPIDPSSKALGKGWFLPAVPKGNAFEVVRLYGSPLAPVEHSDPSRSATTPWAPREAPGTPSQCEEASEDESARARQVLAHAASRVRNAPVGQRNAALNREAYTVGGLVGANRLDEGEATAELVAAIAANGGGHAHDLRKVAQAIGAGRTRPWSPANDNGVRGPGLTTKPDGKTARTVSNLMRILEADPKLAPIAFNELKRQVWRRGQLPWTPGDDGGEWRDEDCTRLLEYISRTYNVEYTLSLLRSASRAVAMGRAFNPVIEYLDALRWDGVPRVDEFLVRYAGVADSPYVRKVGAVFLLSAVARQLTPGCKVDTVVVLEGYQGTKKSSLLCSLASKEFFTDELGSIGAKDADEKLQGTWIIEVPELEKFRKSSVESLKAFISRPTDRFRWTYATEVRDYPRTCIFVGTTNETAYLHDHTGNRRFLPITVGDIDLEAVERDRDQLWAEAVFRKRRGEDHFIRDDEPVLSLARAEQEDRVVRDAWHDIIEEYVLAHDSVGVTLTEVLSEAVRLPPAMQTPSHVVRVQRILVSVGWERKRVTQGSRRIWMYLPKTRKAS